MNGVSAAGVRPIVGLAVIVSLLMAAATPVRAAGKIARLGLFAWQEGECQVEPFHAGLRELGYVEGRNIVIECHHANGQYAGVRPAAVALLRAKPDVMVALHHAYAEVLRDMRSDIATVMISSGDPVATGLATSLARPGGSMTGLTYYAGELNAKRLELLRAVVPDAKRVAVLVAADAPAQLKALHVGDSRAAAAKLGLELRVVETREGSDLERAFQEIVAWKADAVHILPSIVFAHESQLIADLARWHGLPTMHFYTGFPAMGGLMSYGPDFAALQRRAAVYVDKILKGAKPGELPIEQPTHLKLVINRQIASELGRSIPPELLLRADEVIE